MKAINDGRAERLISVGGLQECLQMVPKELVWKLYFELAQSEYRSGSMVPTFDQLTRHCTAGCTALRPRVAAQLPPLPSE